MWPAGWSVCRPVDGLAGCFVGWPAGWADRGLAAWFAGWAVSGRFGLPVAAGAERHVHVDALSCNDRGHCIKEVEVVLTGQAAQRRRERRGGKRTGGDDRGNPSRDGRDLLAPERDIRMTL